MAETLGSLVDKLSIKHLRLWHLDEDLNALDSDDPKREELQAKRALVVGQQKDLAEEIDVFFGAALRGEVKLRDEKVKLYLNRGVRPSDGIKKLGEAVSQLAERNARIWHLEDEARRTDLPDAEIVAVKRKIDAANQERNDLMDKVDEILARQAKDE